MPLSERVVNRVDEGNLGCIYFGLWTINVWRAAFVKVLFGAFVFLGLFYRCV